MSERRDLPSLNEFAWGGGLIYQVAFLGANVILAVMKVPWPKIFHPHPAAYFRNVTALILITLVMVYFAWFRHVRKHRESLAFQPVQANRPDRAMSDEEEANLRPRGGISLIAVFYNLPAIVLNLYMLVNTPFAEL